MIAPDPVCRDEPVETIFPNPAEELVGADVVIGFLRGRLVAKNAPLLVIDVNGVGYEVEVPLTTLCALPETGVEVHLYTHLVVREDAHILFGFSSEPDRALFRTLIRVNGVGAKLALAILSGLSVEAFYRCVHENDTAALVKLPGIGKKTAQRLIIETRDRLPESAILRGNTAPLAAAAGGGPSDPGQEAVSALLSLGYREQDARRMVKAVESDSESTEEIIRLALQSAGRQ